MNEVATRIYSESKIFGEYTKNPEDSWCNTKNLCMVEDF